MAGQTSGYGKCGPSMDARLWGELQSYIDLRVIFAKLPMEEFFQLRRVCKEWNCLASDRGFLEASFASKPIPKPYFVVDSAKMRHRLLTCDPSSGRWSWTRLPHARCEVGGVLCDYDEKTGSRKVFDLHTRVFHELPPPPGPSPIPDVADDFEIVQPVIGMTVSPSSDRAFRIVLGDGDIGTRTYDSKTNSWTQTPSQHDLFVLAQGYKADKKQICVSCNGVLYIRAWEIDLGIVGLHTYNLDRDEWNCSVCWNAEEVEWVFWDIGMWQDRVFSLRMKREVTSEIEVLELTGSIPQWAVSNLNDDHWTVIDRMPEDLRLWLLAGEEERLEDYDATHETQSVFCNELVLIYNCVGLQDVTERAVIYNLNGKTWTKIELPASHRVVTKVVNPRPWMPKLGSGLRSSS
ncbi:hypothetical protein M758_9G076600 [Ceratodon purpureus]|nr:hypothetical protein M758_9G076600 [Ceratodon purpureus]